jgi:hypothetical protein
MNGMSVRLKTSRQLPGAVEYDQFEETKPRCDATLP